MTRHVPFRLTPELAAPGVPPAELVALVRGWWIILLVMSVFTLVGLGYSLLLPEKSWRSEAKLMMEPRDPQVIDIGAVVPALGRDAKILNTQTEVLRSRVLVGRVVDELGLQADSEFNPALAPPGRFDPRPWIKSQLERIPQVRLPETIAQTPLVARTTAVNVLLRKLRIVAEPESLILTVAITTRDPEKSARILDVLTGHYIADQVSAKRAVTEDATGWLTGRVIELKQTLDAAEARARAAGTERGRPTAEALSEMERELSALRELAAASGLSEARRNDLAQRIAALTARIHDASAGLVIVSQLEREAAASALLYETFLARLKETALQTQSHKADAALLSPAVVPLRPVWPRPRLIVMLSAVLGLGVGAVLVLLRETWRVRLRSLEEVEALSGLPVLANLPECPTHVHTPLEEIERRPGGPLAGAVRNLRSTLLLSNLDRPPQVVLMTSAQAGEGKTTTALLLAMTLATWGKSVLLVEADIRGACLQERLGLPEHSGLLSALAGLQPLEKVILRPAGLGIDVVLGERPAAAAADIYATGKFADFIRDVRSRYDFVVIDTPPVLTSADARVIAGSADAVVMCVRWNRTTKAEARRALSQIQSGGRAIAGLVMTRTALKVLARSGQRIS